MASEMIERVARTIAGNLGKTCFEREGTYSNELAGLMCVAKCNSYRSQAIAVLKAMRWPTDKMVKIGYIETADLARANVPPAIIEGRIHRAYCAMIDAALDTSHGE